MHAYSPPATMPNDSIHGGPIPGGGIANDCAAGLAALPRGRRCNESAELLKGASGFSLTRHEPSPSGMDQANVVKRGTVKEFFLAIQPPMAPDGHLEVPSGDAHFRPDGPDQGSGIKP